MNKMELDVLRFLNIFTSKNLQLHLSIKTCFQSTSWFSVLFLFYLLLCF